MWIVIIIGVYVSFYFNQTTALGKSKRIQNMQGPIQEFHNRGRGPGAVEFMGSGDCFDWPSHIPYCVVVRLENNIHIVNIA